MLQEFLSTYLTSPRHIFYILLLSLCLICKFHIYRNSYLLQWLLLYFYGQHNWGKLSCQGQKIFLPISCHAPNMILIRKTFQYIWVKKFLPNQDLAHSQVRPGFGSEIISQYKTYIPGETWNLLSSTQATSALDL